MNAKRRWIVPVSVVVAVGGVSAICWTDVGQVRTSVFVALNRWDAANRLDRTPPSSAPAPTITRLPNGRDWWPGLPVCGNVYPDCEQWTPEQLETMLDENPQCEVAYIWVAWAYRRQKRWADFWSCCDEIEMHFGPNHHFPRAMRENAVALHIPLPTQLSCKSHLNSYCYQPRDNHRQARLDRRHHILENHTVEARPPKSTSDLLSR